MRCTVLGAGSWGTALAAQLARKGHETVLWDRNPERCAVINDNHRNPRYLSTIALPPAVVADPDLQASVARADLVVPAVPSHALRQVVSAAAPAVPRQAVVACATKGIEEDTLCTVHEVLVELLEGPERITLLHGPSFAFEVARDLPTAVVVAGPDRAAHRAAEAFHGETFRTYTTDDVAGCAYGGALKNVMAIACGVADGRGLGANARAGLVTRGLAEISRLAVARGANPLTLMGLAGLGDLVLTCTGDLSRNRRVGLGLGQGRSLSDILEELGEVAEGVRTARSAWQLAEKVGVAMPITEQVHAVLYEGRSVDEALARIMGRERRPERDA